MQSWRRFALEPSALRAPDSLSGPRSLGNNGQHLAATLHRISHDVSTPDNPDAQALYARVAGRLSDLAGLRVEDLTVELDQVREVFTLFLRERNGPRLPARALSEGTLRFLALCVLLEDPGFTGLLCMEEPENGIHPANLPSVINLVRDLAVDPSSSPDMTNPFRQVIVNTHAPGVVQLCDPSDLLLAEVTSRRTAEGSSARSLTLLPFRGSWRSRTEARSFSEADVVSYLTAPHGAQLRLPLEIAG